ncbi:MAG TPA: hypothetical protein VHE83_04905 [Mycobacteriales bacterium]|nr:hypothetical protein [Mycobacteriales bacterium]
MSLAGTRTDAATLVAAVREVHGVADVALDPDDGPVEGAAPGPGVLRLDLGEGIDEVTVATAVGRLLRERFALGVDVASVALVEEAECVLSSESGAPSVERLRVVSAGDTVEVTVTVARDGIVEEGIASGEVDGGMGLLRVVASATLAALEALTEGAISGEVDEVEVLGEPGARRAHTVLSVRTAGGDVSAAIDGEAAVREDPRQAVVRSVVSALAPRLRPAA